MPTHCLAALAFLFIGAGAQASTQADDLETLRAAWPAAMRARLVVARLPANGERPVATYVAPGFDQWQPARLVTYFHGHGADVGKAIAASGVIARIAQLGRDDSQSIFILPQAATPPFLYWMKEPESLVRLEAQALIEAARLADVEVIHVGRRVIAAHSGGGAALANAARAGELRADKVNLLDCTYHDWGLTVARWAIDVRRAGHVVRIESWYTRPLADGGPPRGHAASDPHGGRSRRPRGA